MSRQHSRAVSDKSLVAGQVGQHSDSGQPMLLFLSSSVLSSYVLTSALLPSPPTRKGFNRNQRLLQTKHLMHKSHNHNSVFAANGCRTCCCCKRLPNKITCIKAITTNQRTSFHGAGPLSYSQPHNVEIQQQKQQALALSGKAHHLMVHTSCIRALLPTAGCQNQNA